MLNDNVKNKRGAATSKVCPRGGVIFLRAKRSQGSRLLAMKTTCKSWDCLGCRDQKINHFKSLCSYGVSVLGQCYLLSLTFVNTDVRLSTWTRSPERLSKLSRPHVDALYVSATFKKWLALMSSAHLKFQWLKVPEMTKRGMVHLHLIIGGIGKVFYACETNPNYGRKWRAKMEFCGCLEHVAAKAWLEASGGTSWVVDVRPVLGKFGAAAYLAKYLAKSYTGSQRDQLEQLGFIRRFSVSRGWPRGAEMKRRGTIDKSWTPAGWVKGGRFKRLINDTKNEPEMEQVGTDMGLALKAERDMRKGLKGNVGKYGKIRSEGRGERD